MEYAFEKLAQKLKAARERKGISQRDLSQRTGIPQAQISKIENNTVDLRLSTLANLAHALDLEIELVPRRSLPAVQSLTAQSKELHVASTQVGKEAARIANALARFQEPTAKVKAVLDQIKQQTELVANLPSAVIDISALENVRRLTEAAQRQKDVVRALRRAAEASTQLRNRAVHAVGEEAREQPARPAYTLEDDDG